MRSRWLALENGSGAPLAELRRRLARARDAGLGLRRAGARRAARGKRHAASARAVRSARLLRPHARTQRGAGARDRLGGRRSPVFPGRRAARISRRWPTPASWWSSPAARAWSSSFSTGCRSRPSQSAERVYRVYLGPKEEPRLEALGGGLIRAIDLGYSWVVPLTRLLPLAAPGALLPGAELRRRDHRADDPGAAGDGAAHEPADALDGAHARAGAQAGGAEGQARRRQGEAVRGDDEALSPGGCEPARRMSADGAPDPRVHRAVLCAAQLDRAAPLAVLRLDHGSLDPRVAVHDPRARPSGARAADPDGRLDGRAAEADADADGSRAGEDDADRDAGDDDRDVLSISVGTRALLDGEQRDRHRPSALDRPPPARDARSRAGAQGARIASKARSEAQPSEVKEGKQGAQRGAGERSQKRQARRAARRSRAKSKSRRIECTTR